MQRALTFLVAGVVVLGSACSKGQDAAPAPSAQKTTASEPLVYVSDETGGDIFAVDPVAGKVVATISVGKRLRDIRISHDGKLLYAARTGSPERGPNVDASTQPSADRAADGIAVVDLANRKVMRILESGPDPAAFDISPDEKTLYVSNHETAEMSVLDLASGKIGSKIIVGREPGGVTVRPDGKAVYVTSEEDNEVTVVDSGTLQVIGHLPTAKRPRSLVFAKDGVTAFVTGELGKTVTVIDTSTQRTVESIAIYQSSPTPSGPRPVGSVLSADGKTLYVTCGRGGSVAIIDVAKRKQERSIDGVGDRPWGIALSPDGTHLYTANGTSSDLSIVDIATGNVEKRVHIGAVNASPSGVVVAR